MNLKFSYLDKSDFSKLSKIMFDVLASNMSIISPTGNLLDDDYLIWFEALSCELEMKERQIVLINDGDVFVGFFQYYTTQDTFVMEEIQFKREYHGKGVFEKLYAFLVENLPQSLKFVEAYANKANAKSIGILGHLGLSIFAETKNGFKFKGDYESLKMRYKAVGI